MFRNFICCRPKPELSADATRALQQLQAFYSFQAMLASPFCKKWRRHDTLLNEEQVREINRIIGDLNDNEKLSLYHYCKYEEGRNLGTVFKTTGAGVVGGITGSFFRQVAVYSPIAALTAVVIFGGISYTMLRGSLVSELETIILNALPESLRPRKVEQNTNSTSTRLLDDLERPSEEQIEFDAKNTRS
jgi:hypothetical protein